LLEAPASFSHLISFGFGNTTINNSNTMSVTLFGISPDEDLIVAFGKHIPKQDYSNRSVAIGALKRKKSGAVMLQ